MALKGTNATPLWYGNIISNNLKKLSTKQFFDEHKINPGVNNYSTRDYYHIFDDNLSDYFKHGLYIDGYSPLIDGQIDQQNPFSYLTYKGTPYENNDPVIFGFQIIIDSISSPLLNGSVEDFITQFSAISEISSKKDVIADFKKQFKKLFKTNANLNVNETSVDKLSKQGNSYADSTNNSFVNDPNRSSYMGYYLQKIDGLGKLIETNTSDKKSFLVDYNVDVIKLSFFEDVSSTMSTLAHLYKLLYWSRPNGKNLIPENLLRFNCDIIVSEIRNYKRVRKSISTGNLEEIKDNVSRHVYSLKECQFYFDKMAHNESIDMGNPTVYESYDISFDYKYSTVKFEKWVPDTNNFGKYIGYNNGSLWKIGNQGARSSNGDFSLPKFYTSKDNTFNNNGVKSPAILDTISNNPSSAISDSLNQNNIKTTDMPVTGQTGMNAPTTKGLTTVVSTPGINSTKIPLLGSILGTNSVLNKTSPFFNTNSGNTPIGKGLDKILGKDSFLSKANSKFQDLKYLNITLGQPSPFFNANIQQITNSINKIQNKVSQVQLLKSQSRLQLLSKTVQILSKSKNNNSNSNINSQIKTINSLQNFLGKS